MKRSTTLAMLAAPLLVAVTASAMAQPSPQLEIDFNTNFVVPLSPLLTVIIAALLGVAGVYALRRARGRSNMASWLVAAVLAASLSVLLSPSRLISNVSAFPPTTPVTLTSSPTTVLATAPAAYQVTNGTGATVLLTTIKLNNPTLLPPMAIFAPLTTCEAGNALAAGASCVVFIDAGT